MLIIGCDLISMQLGRLLPSVRATREERRQRQCAENLKRIGLAMHRYHDTYGRFPPSFIPDKNGKPMHSWRVVILPFLGEQSLYNKYAFDQPWNSASNMALAAQMPAIYRCPSGPDPGRLRTSYAMIVGANAISDGPTARRKSDIKDKGANTIMVAEAADAGITWLQPRDINTTDDVLNPSRALEFDISSPHDAVILVLFCDGTVRSLDKGVDKKTLKSMLTIDGGKAIRP